MFPFYKVYFNFVSSYSILLTLFERLLFMSFSFCFGFGSSFWVCLDDTRCILAGGYYWNRFLDDLKGIGLDWIGRLYFLLSMGGNLLELCELVM